MRMKCLAVAGAALLSLSLAMPAAAAPVRRALLVGINDYALPAISDLRGAANDVDMMAGILEKRFGFDRANIVVLKDGAATRAAILTAIDRLVADTQPGDTVYFHYSGHGSQVDDRNGDEADGKDETIVAHDSRKPGVPDITDDEFERGFARLKTPNVLLVFDSCHSGTVTRSVSQVLPRAIPADTRTELYAAATRATVAVETLPHVLMTGAPSDQEALDGPVGEGFYGLFTWALSRSLNENGPAASPEVIHEGVKRELRRIQEQLYMRPPEPQLEAPAARLREPLFASPSSAPAGARRAWAEVRPAANGRVQLLDAAALGAQPGAGWAVYGPGEERFEYGRALATGTVESLAGRDAVLRLEPAAAVPAGSRAIAVTPAGGGRAVTLRLAGVPAGRAAALVGAIAASSTAVPVRIARADEPWRFQAELSAGTWRVRDAGGLREVATVADAPDAQVAAAIAEAIRTSARAADLLSLDNLASDLKLWVGVQSAASAVPGTRAIVLVADDPAPAYRARRPGEPRTSGNSLVLEVQTDRDAWITVVDVDPEGNINQLFPNPVQKPGFFPDGRIPGGQLVRIPDSLAPGNAAGFYWDYSPPAGTDTVRVFAAADPATAQMIRRYIADAAAGARPLGGAGAALVAAGVRGIKLVADEVPAAAPAAAPPAVGQWSAASVIIRVGE